MRTWCRARRSDATSLMQHLRRGGRAERGKRHAQGWKRLDQRCVEQALIALCDIALQSGSAFAQSNPFMPKMSLGGQEKKALSPEEQEKQKQLDADYKAATNKVPDQKANDPWASVRQTPTVPAPKKKQQ